MTALVLVHPGSVFVSGAGEVADWKLQEVIEGLCDEVSNAQGLIVIDNMFSDALPSDLSRLIAEALERSRAAGLPAHRVWGCDSGEAPFAGYPWRGAGPSGWYTSQAQAAHALADTLQEAETVLVSGAWATRDGSSGCVSDVVQTLQAGLPQSVRVEQSADALYEEYMDEFPIEDFPDGYESEDGYDL